jgi:pilus assembly protein CpaF
MVAMAGFALPVIAMRTQIASAVDLIVQVARMKDGIRRITSITEVTGMEGDVVTLKELFAFVAEGATAGQVQGRFEASGLRPDFAPRAGLHGADHFLAEAMGEA